MDWSKTGQETKESFWDKTDTKCLFLTRQQATATGGQGEMAERKQPATISLVSGGNLDNPITSIVKE